MRKQLSEDFDIPDISYALLKNIAEKYTTVVKTNKNRRHIFHRNSIKFMKGNLEAIAPGLRAAFLNEDNLRKYEGLLKLQRDTGYSLQALSIAYLLNQPFQVFPICGVKNTEQLKDVMEAGEICIEPEEFIGKE